MGVASALALAAYIGEARSARDPHCCGESFGNRSVRRDLRRRGIRTCLISCFVFNPAPYQAPVTAVAVTPAVRIMVRTLGALDMVLGVLRVTFVQHRRRDKVLGQEMKSGNSPVGTSVLLYKSKRIAFSHSLNLNPSGFIHYEPSIYYLTELRFGKI